MTTSTLAPAGGDGPGSGGDVRNARAADDDGRPPTGGRWLRSARRWGGLHRQLVTIGLVALVIHALLLLTALVGVRQVDQAHDDASRIAEAQRHFQDADMAHDLMRGDVLAAQVEAARTGPGTVREGPEAVQRAIADFREFLRRVDAVPLPSRLEASLQEIRPRQEQYARRVERVSALLVDEPDAAQREIQSVNAEFTVLKEQQERVTDAMSREAVRRQLAADRVERLLQWRLVAAGVAALLGILGLTFLLHRLGARLAAVLARERGVAELLQQSLLPDRLPDLPGLRLAARYVPGSVGTQVGGDWYDVIALPGGQVGLVMGDVVGHDLQAAAAMGQLRNALRACAADGDAPEIVLERLNRLCVQQGLGDMATVLYGVLDPVAGRLRLASAGHYPPLLVSEHDRCFLDTEPRPPIGAVREVKYTCSVHDLPANSLLLLYTDGLVERGGTDVEEGLARLRALVGPLSDDGLEVVCDQILTGMLGEGQPDDVALLAVATQAVLGADMELMWPAEAERLGSLRRVLDRWLVEVGANEEEVYDVTVACSEAVTNAIEHAYGPGRADVGILFHAQHGVVTITVRDWGQWREARGRDRGRGLSLMSALMDEVDVNHAATGTRVTMTRSLASRTAAPALAELG